MIANRLVNPSVYQSSSRLLWNRFYNGAKSHRYSLAASTTDFLQPRNYNVTLPTPRRANYSSTTTSSTLKYDDWSRYLLFVAGGIVGATVFIYQRLQQKEQCQSVEADDAEQQSKLPEYSQEEISKHNCSANGIWVTFNGGVFDITDFIEQHPGGKSKVILAAGGALEPFWDMYAIHKKGEVLEILEEYRIGKLRKEDIIVRNADDKGPFSTDPNRHPALIMNSKQPFNAETPPQLATDNLITPNELFFTRNHLPVPVVNINDFKVEVNNSSLTISKLSVADLKKQFKEHSVMVALQCAGNRRSEMNAIKTVKGLSWSHNAISNAEWKGVLLKDVLLAAGIDPNSPDCKHIQFEGLDVGPTGAPYGSSVPAKYVFNADSEVILAYEMNGEPIPRDHGYPLRVVIPGIVGARNVKWLSKIIVSKDESTSHWQKNDYKGFSPNIDWGNVDFNSSPAIQELPVTSAICIPEEGGTIDGDEVTIKGYAYSGGGRGIVRVDVSVDGGENWHTATLQQSDQEMSKMYAWTLWEAVVPIPENANGRMNLVSKAVDSSYNCQPDTVSPIWNLRGVLNNAWHKVNVIVSEE